MRRFTEFWAAEAGLSVFTGLLVLDVFVVSPLATLGVLGSGLIDVAFTLLLICGALALHPGRILRIFVGILVGVAIGFRWMVLWQATPWIVAVGLLLVVIALGCFAAIVLRRVFEAGPATMHRVHGAVCAYLLFGLMWAVAYAFLAHVLSNPFSIALDMTGSLAAISPFVYFSFVTLTTVGYGDIAAVHPLARTLVVMEALTGQLYPAIIIGGLVSAALQNRAKS